MRRHHFLFSFLVKNGGGRKCNIAYLEYHIHDNLFLVHQSKSQFKLSSEVVVTVRDIMEFILITVQYSIKTLIYTMVKNY